MVWELDVVFTTISRFLTKIAVSLVQQSEPQERTGGLATNGFVDASVWRTFPGSSMSGS